MWEVSIKRDIHSRLKVAENVEGAALERAIAAAYKKAAEMEARSSPILRRYAVCITRMDWTPEARRTRWEAEFYDITRSGARRRRYKKPAIEAEWEQWVKDERKRDREAARVRNASRRGR